MRPGELVAVDIGGTHARFAVARSRDGGRPALDPPVTLKTREHPSLALAWEAFARRAGDPLPRAAAICVAAPVTEDTVKLTNGAWVLRRSSLAGELGLDRALLLNDFGAMAWAVSSLGDEEFEWICGADDGPPDDGVITVLGPGTGLGVAQLVRRGGRVEVLETEGGHVEFAPLDPFERDLAERLRQLHSRVSVERVVSGPGLAVIAETLAAARQRTYRPGSDAELWAAALSGEDELAGDALDRFCEVLGSVAGDLALAHGAAGVVLVGGLARRLEQRLRGPGFQQRFRDKGRYHDRMARLPVYLATHPEPGLLGAAVAFLQAGDPQT